MPAASAEPPGCCLLKLKEETILDAIVQFLRANRPTPRPIYTVRPLCTPSDLGNPPRLHRPSKPDFLIYGIGLGDYLSPPTG